MIKTCDLEMFADIVATSKTKVQIEIQPQIGFKDKLMLYIHIDGITVLQIGRLTNEQIDLQIEPLI